MLADMVVTIATVEAGVVPRAPVAILRIKHLHLTKVTAATTAECPFPEPTASSMPESDCAPIFSIFTLHAQAFPSL